MFGTMIAGETRREEKISCQLQFFSFSHNFWCFIIIVQFHNDWLFNSTLTRYAMNGSGLKLRVHNENLIFLFLNQNICCGYLNEPSQLNICLNWWVRKYLQFYDENLCLSKPVMATIFFSSILIPTLCLKADLISLSAPLHSHYLYKSHISWHFESESFSWRLDISSISVILETMYSGFRISMPNSSSKAKPAALALLLTCQLVPPKQSLLPRSSHQFLFLYIANSEKESLFLIYLL